MRPLLTCGTTSSKVIFCLLAARLLEVYNRLLAVDPQINSTPHKYYIFYLTCYSAGEQYGG